jgi:hypothetical protein
MYNNILALQNSPRLTCVWVPTGNLRMPLVCVWVDGSAQGNCKAITSSDESREQLCA